MRRVNTAEFKREYRSLGEPVLVTSGGKMIGVYRPTNRSIIEEPWPTVTGKPSEHQVSARTWNASAVSIGTNPPAVSAIVGRFLGWRRTFAYPEDPNAR